MRPLKRVHKLSAAAKADLYGLGQEFIHKTISKEEYTRRGKEIVQEDRKDCRRECCGRKPRTEKPHGDVPRE